MDNIELQTRRLNKLVIKESMYISSGYEVPEHVKTEIAKLRELLKNIKIKTN